MVKLNQIDDPQTFFGAMVHKIAKNTQNKTTSYILLSKPKNTIILYY